MSLLPIALATAPPIWAHSSQEVGPFEVEMGWLFEPTFVGQPNAVQLVLLDHENNHVPVTDVAPGALTVIVSMAGVDSPPLTLDPAFDAEEGEGRPGEYRAAIIPTAPGDYTFHLVGTIRDFEMDATASSADGMFDAVQGPSELEFPAKLPTLSEVATRLDRIDGRIQDLQAADPGAEARAAAEAATDAANRALLTGTLLGGAGLIFAVVALWLAWRAGRRGTGTA